MAIMKSDLLNDIPPNAPPFHWGPVRWCACRHSKFCFLLFIYQAPTTYYLVDREWEVYQALNPNPGSQVTTLMPWSCIPYCCAYWHMRQKVNVCLYLNIGAAEVYCDIYNIGAPAIFNYFSNHGFSAIGAWGKKHDNTVCLIVLQLL